MIACFLRNISAKYYKNMSMLSRVIAKTLGMFFETQCIFRSATDVCHVNIEWMGQHAAVELWAARAARGRRDIHSADSDVCVKT